jgi:branched-chain amino acid transport system ATP-binding protein
MDWAVEARPAQLSMGQRKLLGVARALAAEPLLLCLDKPAAGLDTRESEEFGARLRGLADRGQSMLLIEHDMGLVLGICDRVIVLEFGQVIAEGLPDAVRQDSRVIAAYLGGGTTSGSGTDDAGIMSSTLAELASPALTAMLADYQNFLLERATAFRDSNTKAARLRHER